jgi:hypothetical protein
MKTFILAATAILATALSSVAQTTFSVIKLSAAIPCSAQAPDFSSLINTTLTTKILINIALDRDITTPVPNNIVLGYAGDFSAFGHHTPVTTSPVKLVVYDTETQTKLKTIGIASDRTVVESRFSAAKFKRIGLGTLTIQDTSGGSTNSFFTGGSLQIAGTVIRKPNGIATPGNLTVTALTTVVGTIQATYIKKGETTTGTFIATKGTLRGSGKIVGTFTE